MKLSAHEHHVLESGEGKETHSPEIQECLAHQSGLEDQWDQVGPGKVKRQRKCRVEVMHHQPHAIHTGGCCSIMERNEAPTQIARGLTSKT